MSPIRPLIAEMLGTFAVVFAGTGAIIINQISGGAVTHVGIALTFGLVVMAMIYAVGDASGAHLNPAVTIGFVAARRISARQALQYILAQVLGALLATTSHRILFGNVAHLGATLPAHGAGQSLLLEMILTAMLMFVILCVSTGPKETGVMAGTAIGAVIGLEAMFAGPISGASMNPARSLAPALISGTLTHVWVYLTGPTAGAMLGVLCWRGVGAGSRSPIGVATCPQNQT